METRTLVNVYEWTVPALNQAYTRNGLNQYTDVANTSFAYDRRGNLTSDGSRTLAYDLENHLLTVTGTASGQLSYDPLGRLRSITANSVMTEFLYDGDRLVAEYDPNRAAGNQLLRRYVHGAGVDEPVVWYECPSPTPGACTSNRNWLIADRQGSIIATTDGAGAATIYRYGPYGEPEGGVWTGSRFRYTGQIALPELRHYHYKARVLDPYLGRFLQADPVGYIGDGARRRRADYLVSDTRMQVQLGAPLAHGGQVRLHILYHFTIPTAFGGRTSWGPNPHGDIYDVAQFYPRLAVYDDIRGWDTAPYLAQEFYLEYGDFDYAVTVPADMVVAGSGELVNAREVLTPVQMQRLAQARTSDATVTIRTAEEANVAAPSIATRTWRFHMHNTRDVAFAASRAFVWDAARINLPEARTALAMSFYPPESGGAKAWGRSSEYLKHAVEEFSRRWYPYPWPNAINVAGPTSGMEYPGIVFDGPEDRGRTLFWISAHEIGHTWFPMIVGFDERRHAWMDEGFNTFIDVYESDAFQNGAYGPKRDSEYAPHGGNPADEILPVLADPNAPPILSRSDTVLERYRHPVTYFKSAFGLVLLREQILGPERFDPAFRAFIRAWAFRHPQPADFFRFMESEAGEDLSWFWREWYFENTTYDVAVAGVDYVDHDPAKGAIVALVNCDPMVFPTSIEITLADGARVRQRIPVETWMLRASAPISVDTTQRILSVTVDPDNALPDRNRSNNVWRASH